MLLPIITDLYNDPMCEQLGLQVSIQDFIWWLCCRHIEDCMLLQVQNFNYRSKNHEDLYYELLKRCPNLHVLFTQFIRSPQIFQDNEVNVFLNGTNIHISYYAARSTPAFESQAR